MGSNWKPDKTLHWDRLSRPASAPNAERPVSAQPKWQSCPATNPPHQTGARALACFRCDEGTCVRLNSLGLATDSSGLPWLERPQCGALGRDGHRCKNRVVPGRRRCKFHGGYSTGPRTPAGRKIISLAQKKRWAKWRRDQFASSETGTNGVTIGIDDRRHQKRGPMFKDHPTRVMYEDVAKTILRKQMRISQCDLQRPLALAE